MPRSDRKASSGISKSNRWRGILPNKSFSNDRTAGIAGNVIFLLIGIAMIGFSLWTLTDPHSSVFYYGIGIIGLVFIYVAITTRSPDTVNKDHDMASKGFPSQEPDRGPYIQDNPQSDANSTTLSAHSMPISEPSDDNALRAGYHPRCPNCFNSIEEDWQSCPLCGFDFKSSCSICGEKLDPTWVACPSCGQAVARYCPTCNTKLETGWTTCPYCGS
jgi:hypothetical protein